MGIPRGILIENDFGGSVGGPILKDKLFFFASLSNFRQPFNSTVTAEVATPLALSGIYTLPDGKTDNVLQAGASAGCANCPGSINPIIAGDLTNIEATYKLAGATLTPVDANHENLNFLNKGATVNKFPTLRPDYNLTEKFRLTASANESNSYNTNAAGARIPAPNMPIRLTATSKGIIRLLPGSTGISNRIS